MKSSDEAGSGRRLLVLLTDEISSVLVRGQLGFMVSEGFDVTVAARLAAAPAPKTGAWDDGVAVEHLPFVREPSPLADLRALWATWRLVRRLRPDIVNASTPKAGLLGMLAARLGRVPVRVYVVRGFRFETAVGSRRRLFRGLERLAIRSATHVVFNSDSLRAVGEREGVIRPGAGEVIGGGSGNGIDIARFGSTVLPTRSEARQLLGVPDEALVVGFVRRFTRDNGIGELVRSIQWLVVARPSLRLLLVGQFEDGDPVAADVRAAIEHDAHVTVVPWLDHTGVAYRAMDVLAFPSHREGLPNVPLEAQLCRVPVVGYAATGTVDAVRDGATGVLVPTGDESAFAEALAELVDDPARRAELGAEGADWVRATFDREQVWNGWFDRYLRWLTTP